MIAYRLESSNSGSWLYLGVGINEVTESIGEASSEIIREMQEQEGHGLEDRSTFKIAPFEITQNEIDNMKDFQGFD